MGCQHCIENVFWRGGDKLLLVLVAALVEDVDIAAVEADEVVGLCLAHNNPKAMSREKASSWRTWAVDTVLKRVQQSSSFWPWSYVCLAEHAVAVKTSFRVWVVKPALGAGIEVQRKNLNPVRPREGREIIAAGCGIWSWRAPA